MNGWTNKKSLKNQWTALLLFLTASSSINNMALKMCPLLKFIDYLLKRRRKIIRQYSVRLTCKTFAVFVLLLVLWCKADWPIGQFSSGHNGLRANPTKAGAGSLSGKYIPGKDIFIPDICILDEGNFLILAFRISAFWIYIFLINNLLRIWSDWFLAFRFWPKGFLPNWVTRNRCDQIGIG